MLTILDIRRRLTSLLIAYLWLHVPAIGALAKLIATDWLIPTIGAASCAGAATAMWALDRDGAAARHTVCVALMAMPAFLVHVLSGHPWQIDMHMYFFATLAMTVAFCDWRSIMLAAGAVAVHHLALNMLVPFSVFPNGASFGRVMIHAAIVIIETGVLAWIAWRLARALEHTERSASEAEQAHALALEANRERDRTVEDAARTRRETMDMLAAALDKDIGAVATSIRDAACDMESAAKQLDGLLGQIMTDTTEMAGAAGQAAGNVRTVAAATTDLSTSIAEINRHLTQSGEMSRNAVGMVERANATVEGLSSAAGRIGDVVSLIHDIASRTNLLALNATIEAARAGEAGKGFAIVASEVKTLSNQTARATEEISNQITQIQTSTDGTVAAIREIGSIIVAIDGIVATIAQAAEQQSVATADITRNVREATQGTDILTRKMAVVDGTLARLDGMSEERLVAAQALSKHSEQLRIEMDTFLAGIRAH